MFHMAITKILLFASTILLHVDCFVRVDNYQNSVYIQKRSYDPFTPASSITFLEPVIYDYMSVDTETAVDGVGQRGHLVQFYKYMYRKDYVPLFPIPSLRYYFTNEQRSLLEIVTYTVLPECIENLNGTDDKQPCHSCEDVNHWTYSLSSSQI